MFIQDTYEFAKGDDNLIKFLGIDVYAVMADINGRKTNIQNLLSPRTIEFYENKILEEIKQ